MKTGNIPRGGVPLTQAKPILEDKVALKKSQNENLVDKVNLSATGTSLSTPLTSYGEAMNLARGMDFRIAMDAHKISKDAAMRLMELL